MRKVHIYVGRDAIDYDCIQVDFVIDGVKYSYETHKDGTYGGKDKFTYLDSDFDIQIRYFSSAWHITIYNINTDEISQYYNNSNNDFPVYKKWLFETGIGENYELDYVGDEYCYALIYERLELFNDEKINVTSTVQNITDISKTFTDFSQSFTVPGSVVNNKIFEHFYQNDIDGTIDYNLRRPAYIEIDYLLFRKGVIALEKANVKNGKIDNYSISFYGQLTSLKDIFGEDKLNQLDLSSLEFTYNGTNVYNRITDLATDYDVRYPLIANNRLWSYNDNGSEDICKNDHAIQYTELFPAVKVIRLIEAIEAKYNIDLQSSFFSDDRFTKLFLLAKNDITYLFLTALSDIDFISKTFYNDIYWYYTQSARDFVNIADNTINVKSFGPDLDGFGIEFNVSSKSTAGTFYIEVYKNGIYDQTFTRTTTGLAGTIAINDNGALNDFYTFKVKAATSMNLVISTRFIISAFSTDPYGTPTTTYSETIITSNTVALVGSVQVSNTLPDIKVADFFSGIMKQFNMTCVGIDERKFQVLPLDDWYNEGITYDITNYVDIDSIDYSKMPLYKKIAFKYEQGQSFVNRQYFKTSNSEYGDTSNAYAYDGQEYIIQSPFENLLFTRAEDPSGNQAILGYLLNENYQAYTPKPTLLYLYGESDALVHDFKFYNGTSNVNIHKYALFGQDLTISSVKYSLNWGADNSIIHLETIQNGLFATYYFNYLSNLYNLKQRLVSLKANLPASLINYLKLNDRVIIRDKRYIINDFRMELTSGEAQVTLYNDFVDVTE